MTLEFQFQEFLNEKRYLNNSSHNSILFYEQSFKAFNLQAPLTQRLLNERVAALRQQGKSPSCCNAYIRGINSFLSWLSANGYTTEKLRVKSLRAETRVMKTFNEAQVKAIVLFKPRTSTEKRLHALLCLIIDTGVRINEALTLTRERVDVDNLLVTVSGKGNKQRMVPISIECRRILFRFLQTHKFDLVFCTKQGRPLLYDNTRRDFQRFMDQLGISGFDGSFHAFRRFFACNYVRNGGNVFYLQRMLGHATLTMSKKYVEVDTQDLQRTHLRTSILSRVRVSVA
jgi:site-specific recombinase XerD